MQTLDAIQRHEKTEPAEHAADSVFESKYQAKCLALGELRSATCLLQAVLLALDHASIAGQETGLLEVGTVIASVQKSASNAQTKGAGLAGDAAAIKKGDDIEGTEGIGNLEGSESVLDQLLAAKVLLGIALVNGDLTGTGNETDAGNGVLTTAGALINNGVLSHL